jgi:hypothetical protein
VTCAKAVLAAWMALSAIGPGAAEPEMCVDVANISCTVLELCVDGYDGDGCFKTAQISKCREPESR